ncbi:MAG TPA: nicotinate (nicotinamide) nucleotide adenylyltransferase [candidate division Zixibacteria bacterium]|nr:nicotinate (nicotinamide) nucleotide adenylyltransferase [candidate division Zixibacteria bacterium]
MPQANPNDGGNWGIMGGAFDPVHNGHLILAESALGARNLDGVLFIPSFNPPHRCATPIATFDDRVTMTELAIKGNSRYCLSRLEENIDGPGYTLTIIKHLKDKYPETGWYLILGADNIVLFDSWHKPEEIVKHVKVIVGGRPGFNKEFEKSVWYDKIARFDMPQTDISSTAIRKLLKAGKSVKSLLPESVNRYIQERGLYR